MRIAKLKKAKVRYIDITNEGNLRYDQLAELVNDKTRVSHNYTYVKRS